jgi:hypothetical protein
MNGSRLTGPALALVVVAVAATPRAADACETKTVCVVFEGIYDDLTTGAFPALENDRVYARGIGVRTMVFPPAPEPPQEIFADTEGCITFESEFHTGFEVVVFPEAVLGQNRNIRLDIAWPDQKPWVGRVHGMEDESDPIRVSDSVGCGRGRGSSRAMRRVT